MTTFATRLREARLKAGLSQPQLAERAGMPVGSIRNLEQGVRADPRLSTLSALASALGLTVTGLVGK